MTKLEMINEMLNEVKNLSDNHRELCRQKILRKPLERIEQVYNQFLKDRRNALYYICVLK